MQVIFIHHSCFLVEVDDLVLILIIWRGSGEWFPLYGKDSGLRTGLQKSICLPATNIRIILTWIFCAGVKNIPIYIIFYPRISASVRIFCKKHGIDPGVRKKSDRLSPQTTIMKWMI